MSSNKERAQLIVASNLSMKHSARVNAEALIDTIEVNLDAAREVALTEIETVINRRFDLNPDDGYYLQVEIKKVLKELRSKDEK